MRDPWYYQEDKKEKRREREVIDVDEIDKEQEREEEGEEKEEEGEPDFTKYGSQVLVCRRTNACPLHRTRKKRCPANW